jgi:hypothetical protein
MNFAATTTLGALFGPLWLVAVGATLVTLGVVIVGLIAERRETASIRRLATSRHPITVVAAGSGRQAA